MESRTAKQQAPHGESRVLLHTCCAPCSAPVIEAMLADGLRPTLFYFNPNIYPEAEYELRKNENKKHAQKLGLEFIDADYNRQGWLNCIMGLEKEPERGRRCLECFKMRLYATAEQAQSLGLRVIATTLTSSRWKSTAQVDEAGSWAASQFENVAYWARNWKSGGLTELRAKLLRENGFYNQKYCGCEFSIKPTGK